MNLKKCIFQSVFLESVCLSNNSNRLVQVQPGRRLLLFPTAVDTAKPQTNSQKYICPNCKVYFFQLLIVFVSFYQQCRTHCKDTCQFEKVKKNCKSIIDALPKEAFLAKFHVVSSISCGLDYSILLPAVSEN